MARKINQLTPLKVEQLIKNTRKPRMVGDGLNLYLMIRRQGEGAWCFRYKIDGVTRLQGLGATHTVSLQEARERARQARQLILDGKDPLAVKAEARAAAKAEALRTMTFAEACEAFLKTDKIASLKNHKHRQQWRTTLDEACKTIGKQPLQSINSADVLRVLQPVWERAPETGSRLRGRIEKVFHWAMPLGLFTGDNPADRALLESHLPAKPKQKHHSAMPHANLRAFMQQLQGRNSVSAAALAFTILTATRTAESIGAQWSEIDLAGKVWTIPAARMKAKRDHRVPLCKRAVEILRKLPTANQREGFIFINGGGRVLSNMAMLELLRGMTGNGETVHGFRSAFSDWARDRTSYARDVIEQALAHTIKDKSERAYRRGDALDKRRRLMAEWAEYCGGA